MIKFNNPLDQSPSLRRYQSPLQVQSFAGKSREDFHRYYIYIYIYRDRVNRFERQRSLPSPLLRVGRALSTVQFLLTYYRDA